MDLARALVQAGAKLDTLSTNVKSSSPLHIAVGHGFRDLAAFLIGAGADRYIVSAAGSTPLHWAIYMAVQQVRVGLVLVLVLVLAWRRVGGVVFLVGGWVVFVVVCLFVVVCFSL